jgi:hypothetical protein
VGLRVGVSCALFSLPGYQNALEIAPAAFHREPKYVPEHIQMLLEHIVRLSNPKSIYDLIGN